jgi:predicted metal-dependent phosphotriesterase family hydrolase
MVFRKSKEECVQNLSEMIVASLEEAIESNQIKGMLKELGFSLKILTAPQKEYYELSVEACKNMNILYLKSSVSSIRVDKPVPERISK